jgi:hypothetical protein
MLGGFILTFGKVAGLDVSGDTVGDFDVPYTGFLLAVGESVCIILT